jgi:hypothetical protein
MAGGEQAGRASVERLSFGVICGVDSPSQDRPDQPREGLPYEALHDPGTQPEGASVDAVYAGAAWTRRTNFNFRIQLVVT